MSFSSSQYRKSAGNHWKAGRLDDALADAWRAHDAGPDEQAAKILLAHILRANPHAAMEGREAALRRLLNDPAVDPSFIVPAGWCHLLRTSKLFSAEAVSAPAVMTEYLETDAFSRELLQQEVVTEYEAELHLARARRWLLLSGRWREFPNSAEALVRQAACNGGAWLFDADEEARLESGDNGAIARAYRPEQRTGSSRLVTSDPVTRAVAKQYEVWPYPQWTRVTASKPTTLREDVAALDPDGPDSLARDVHILIAGCGTGRQAAMAALRYPDARITAIDFSEESLRYAAARCRAAGLNAIEFRAVDLHRVDDLQCRFDAVFCTGVLHHLPDPEKGWAALAATLKPGGVMRVMVYSKLARMGVRALRSFLGDLEGRPVDDDLLREVRRRILGRGRTPKSIDFYSLAGVHDLLLHRHEDPFDVPRIRRALEELGLDFVGFALPSPLERARYRAENPHDPLQRDFAGWTRAEKHNPTLFAGMYDFWCRKPVA